MKFRLPYLGKYCMITKYVSPRYNRNGWPGVKHQVTYTYLVMHNRPRSPINLLSLLCACISADVKETRHEQFFLLFLLLLVSHP